jgi:multiple sugar transport system substrate-binding protein
VIKQMNPGLPYGITTLPSYKGQTPSSWVGGWCAGIPKGSKNPDAAWEFLKWITASPDGTTAVGKATDEFPGYKPSPFLNQLDPQLALFYPILKTTLHQRPVTPAEDYYMGQLNNEVSNALYGKKTPLQALTDCTNNVQAYINKEILKKA